MEPIAPTTDSVALSVGAIYLRQSVLPRIAKYTRKQPNGCWLWCGSTNGHYGVLSVNGKNVMVHRFLWVLKHGAPPAGFELDHKCLNKRCIRPNHLEPVTTATNNGRHRASANYVAIDRKRIQAGVRANYARHWAKGPGGAWVCSVCHQRGHNKRSPKCPMRSL